MRKGLEQRSATFTIRQCIWCFVFYWERQARMGIDAATCMITHICIKDRPMRDAAAQLKPWKHANGIIIIKHGVAHSCKNKETYRMESAALWLNFSSRDNNIIIIHFDSGAIAMRPYSQQLVFIIKEIIMWDGISRPVVKSLLQRIS